MTCGFDFCGVWHQESCEASLWAAQVPTSNTGSGKGTQIKRIKESAAIQHISSGDVLRDNIHRRTPVGLAVQSTMAEGRLVDDRIVARLVLDRVAALINDTFILDGFPRTVEQAKSLDQFLESNRAALDVVINLDVPWQTIVERIADRWIHAPSGRTYNINYNPPKTAGLDDVTGEKLVKREVPVTYPG